MASDATANRLPATAHVLGVAGLMPLAVAAVTSATSVPGFESSAATRFAIIYSALILSFLGGIRWGAALMERPGQRHALELLGGVFPLLAGLVAVFLPQVLALCLLISGLLMQALWDVRSAEDGRFPAWFSKLRMVLTAGAVVALTIILARAII